jgi:hypothetical protein
MATVTFFYESFGLRAFPLHQRGCAVEKKKHYTEKFGVLSGGILCVGEAFSLNDFFCVSNNNGDTRRK